MAITLVLSGQKLIYTKDSCSPMYMIVSRISNYEKGLRPIDLFIDMSGEINILRFENETDRNNAMTLIDNQFL